MVDACGSCSHCAHTTLPADAADSGTSMFTFSIVMSRNYPRIAQKTESPIGGTPSRRAQAVRDPLRTLKRSLLRRHRPRLASGRASDENPPRSQIEERDLMPPRSPLQVDRRLASLDELIDHTPDQHRGGRLHEPSDLHVICAGHPRTGVLVPENLQHPFRNAGLDAVVCMHDVIPRSRAQHRRSGSPPIADGARLCPTTLPPRRGYIRLRARGH